MGSKRGQGPAGPIVGNFSPAPAGAPHETSQPLDPAALEAMIQKAGQHERELKPLQIQTPPGIQLLPPKVQEPGPESASPGLAEVPPTTGPQVPSGGAAGTEGDPVAALAQEFNTPPSPVTEDGPRRPAESNTDSPARGIPRPILDPGKQIQGGWGEGGPSGQYFALDGAELAAVVNGLITGIRGQMGGDLRFGIATVYPQVRVRVLVQIDGIDPSVPITEQKFDLAQSRIVELVEEVQDDDLTPADAIRDQAQLPKPRKQSVQSGATRIMVDVPHTGTGTAAGS